MRLVGMSRIRIWIVAGVALVAASGYAKECTRFDSENEITQATVPEDDFVLEDLSF